MFDGPQTQAHDGTLPEFGENLGSAAGVAPLPAMLMTGLAVHEEAWQQGLNLACGLTHAAVAGYFAGLRLMLRLPQSPS